jgi:Ca-activated chloride channel family protein
MDLQIGNASNLMLLWIVVAVLVALIMAGIVRRRALARFATSNLLARLIPSDSRRGYWPRAALGIVCLLALVLALVDVRWGKTWREVPQKGIEVMFVLDVSRSMLAEDIAPNRLERAKQQIKDMVDEMAGDRVGLVVFSGDVRQQVPLTSHYEDFKQTLDEVGPHNVNRGGSRLGDAIRAAGDAFLDKTGDHKAIVVFTDGEDHESRPVDAAKQLREEKGIRIFTVGLGDMQHGSRIPIRLASGGRSYLQHNGQQVWSKMNGDILKEVAMTTDGAYIPAGTKQVDMAGVYRDYVTSVEQTDFETAKINSYIPRYQWLVGIALAAIFLETFLVFGRRMNRKAQVSA